MLVCGATWAQTTVDFSSGLPSGWTKSGTVTENANHSGTSKECISLGANAEITSPIYTKAFSKMKLSIARSGNGKDFTVSYKIGNNSAVDIETYTTTEVTDNKNAFDFDLNIPEEAQVEGCKFLFKSSANTYYIFSIEFTENNKTATSVSFGSNYSGKTFTFTEGVLEGFTPPVAEEATGVEGTITYSSDNTDVANVDNNGKLSFTGYGTANITATFTPANKEKYNTSIDSYQIINRNYENPTTFSSENKSFAGISALSGNSYKSGNVNFVSAKGNSYIFNCNRVLLNNDNLQVNNSTITSPTFDSYKNGYTVSVTYSSKKGTVTLSSGDKQTSNDKGGSNGSGMNVSLEVEDGSAFTLSIDNNATYISKIEIVPTNATTAITFNDTETNSIASTQNAIITLNRALVPDNWNTFCVPFDITEEQAKAAFGEGVKIRGFEAEVSDEKEIMFDDATTTIEAGKPYIIKPTKAMPDDGYVFNGVDIVADGPTTLGTTGNIQFRGIYNKADITTLATEGTYAAGLGDQNKILKAEAGGEMRGFRAFFLIPNSTKAANVKVRIDGEETAIDAIHGAETLQGGNVYNLSGQCVGSSLNGLKKGVYIQNGRKVIVK